MAKAVKRAYKYRFYPSPGQAAELYRTFGCVRKVYNLALEARTTAWYQRQERVSYVQSSAMLTEWKRDQELAFLNEVSCVPLQQSLRHLQRAFAAFWDKRARYPKFKSRKRSRASAEYTRSGFRWHDGTLTLAKMAEPLDIRWSRPLPEGAEPSTVTVSCDSAGRWYVSILVQTTIQPLPPGSATVGVDVGLTSLLALSTGEKIANPKHEHRDRERLARARRALSRKARGSANRDKARVKVARVCARITDRRRDHLHKLTTRLVRENQAVVIEDLRVANMVRNHSLARAISDAAWGDLRSMLEYKCVWYGRDLIVIDRWYPSSKTCSGCGHQVTSLPLGVREWTCPSCGAVHDRDVNAAVNIRAAGLAVLACGDDVRPKLGHRDGQSSAKQETRPAREGIPVIHGRGNVKGLDHASFGCLLVGKSR
jgi:putative transposase